MIPLSDRHMKTSAVLLGLLSITFAQPAHALDERYPLYEPRSGLSGSVEVAGESVPRSLMLVWEEGFRTVQSGVTLVETGEGEAAGTVKIRAAVETLAVLVHRDNPLQCLPLSAVKEIYTAENPLWGDVGGTGEWQAMPVTRFIREADTSDTVFFASKVLGKEAFAGGTTTLTRASALLRALEASPGGIAYAPAGYRAEGVRPLRISDGGDCAAPTVANAHGAAYPLARIVHLEAPAGEASRAFFDYVLSREGQHDASITGHYPLPYVFAAEERRKLGLD